MTRAFASLSPAEQGQLKAELVALWTAHNRSTDDTRTIVDSEYLEVLGVTRTMSPLFESDDAIW